MGVYVDSLVSRRLFCCILIFTFIFAGAACSEPDERWPFPTGKDKDEAQVTNVPAMMTSGLWKSPCVEEIEGDIKSRYFELQISEDGHFIAKENQFNNPGCKPVPDSRRTRNGKINSLEKLAEQTWKAQVHMYEHGNMGDLVSADIMIKVIDGQAHIKPIEANLFDVGDEIHKTWDNDDTTVWVLDFIK